MRQRSRRSVIDVERAVLEPNQHSVCLCEAAGVEGERPQVIFEVDVEPLAARLARSLGRHSDQVLAHTVVARHPTLGTRQARVTLAPGEGRLVQLAFGAAK